MTKFPAELAVLMPKPKFSPTKGLLAGVHFFTADQVRQAILDATERAAKLALDKAYDAMFDLKGDKVTRFDAQTAVRKLRDAPSIGRSTSRGEGE
jgi:hypothetical protein